MPRLNDETTTFTGGGFQFSAVPLDKLTETGYTLVTLVRDVTGSLTGFENDLLHMTQEAVRGCKKSPRAENILLRLVDFNTVVKEFHGYRHLPDIDPDADYAVPSPHGSTALFDATHNALSATADYGEKLAEQDFDVNALVLVITDGEDNASKSSPTMIADLLSRLRGNENLSGVTVLLIGINDASCRVALERFQKEAGLDAFVPVGDVTPGKLAKLAGFVSQSVSSSSQSLVTGQPAAAPSITF